MGSKRYNNKGVNAERARQSAKDESQKSSRITAIVCVAILLIVAVTVAVALAVDHQKNTADSGIESESGSETRAVTVTPAAVDMAAVADEIDSKQVSDFRETASHTDYVKITVRNYGDIVVRLREDVAPISVTNFKTLVFMQKYTGSTFYRIIKNFMIQGGTVEGVSSIKGEFASNGVENNLRHIRGVISMARATAPDSASSTFFICDATDDWLDGNYAAFGYVVAGMSTVDAIAAIPTDANDAPPFDVVIESAVFVEPID